MAKSRPGVILLPGAVLPAELAYADLLRELRPEADAHSKELELYASGAVPADYGFELEFDGILREAERNGFDRFHLVGYSAGAAISLAFCAAHPDRLLTLTLNETPWADMHGRSAPELERWAELDRIMDLPPEELMPAFIRAQLRDDVPMPPPPPGPTPPWMALRPSGIRALMHIFHTYDLDMDVLRRFERPVLFTLGALSHPGYYAEIAQRLASVFPDFTLEVFEERHHFDPPHRTEPARMASSLRQLWSRAA